MRPREKWMIAGVLGILAVLVVGLAISVGTAAKHSGHGCVAVDLAYSTGGSQTYTCGAGARSLCAGIGRDGQLTGQTGRIVAQSCRRAGLRVG
jgi:hypothetical protein